MFLSATGSCLFELVFEIAYAAGLFCIRLCVLPATCFMTCLLEGFVTYGYGACFCIHRLHDLGCSNASSFIVDLFTQEYAVQIILIFSRGRVFSARTHFPSCVWPEQHQTLFCRHVVGYLFEVCFWLAKSGSPMKMWLWVKNRCPK